MNVTMQIVNVWVKNSMLIFLVLLINSCSHNDQKNSGNYALKVKKMISKKWSIAGIDFNKLNIAKSAVDSIFKEQTNSLIQGGVLNFEPNGDFVEKINNQKRQGKWNLSNKTGVIEIEFSNQKEYWKIHAISRDSLSIATITKEGSVKFNCHYPSDH